MKKYFFILLLCTMTMYANSPCATDVENMHPDPPPITMSPAYMPPKYPKKTVQSNRRKTATIIGITVIGIGLGLIASGHN